MAAEEQLRARVVPERVVDAAGSGCHSGGESPRETQRERGDDENECDARRSGVRSVCYASERRASIAATLFGTAAESTRAPSSVTSTSSSMRMPMPRQPASTASQSGGT